MQLAAFNNNNFALGHAAMLVNEGLPLYVVSQLGDNATTSPRMTVGILGMSFKAEIRRHPLEPGYKLKRILAFKARKVLMHRPVRHRRPRPRPARRRCSTRPTSSSIATPHPEYRDLETDKPVVDVWNVLGTA